MKEDSCTDGQFEMLDGDAMIVLLVDYIAPLVNTLNARELFVFLQHEI